MCLITGFGAQNTKSSSFMQFLMLGEICYGLYFIYKNSGYMSLHPNT